MHGPEAVRFARSCAEKETGAESAGVPLPESFDAPSGAFVTFRTYPERDLRGCIGYPYPVMPLKQALAESARSACHDPRFPVLKKEELGKITVEVTILTPPEPVTEKDPQKIIGSIGIGRDGLMIECRGRRGLLLPQVATEQGWDAPEFLQWVSAKAGLPPDAWTYPDARLFTFRGTIFSEKSPYGEITGGE